MLLLWRSSGSCTIDLKLDGRSVILEGATLGYMLDKNRWMAHCAGATASVEYCGFLVNMLGYKGHNTTEYSHE